MTSKILINNLKENQEEELLPAFDSRASFYKKAIYKKEGSHLNLYSYNTLVAYYNLVENKLYINGWYSNTTARHINEFIQQLGFKKLSKAEMIDAKATEGNN